MDIRNLGRKICDEIAGVLAGVDAASTERLVESIIESQRVYLAGLGRSGWAARCLATRLTHLSVDTHIVGDATTPAIGPDDLLIACSGSGETPTILGFADAAKRADAHVALITACPDSTAAQVADLVVHLPAPTPKAKHTTDADSIQPMGSLFEQSLLVFGDALVLLLANRLEQDHDTMWQRHTNLE